MRIVVTGASGQLGCYLVEHLESLGHPVHAWCRRDLARPLGLSESSLRSVDITVGCEVVNALDAADPDIVFHLAAISAADAVFTDPERGFATNVQGTRNIADWCERRGRKLVFTSTDLVFDGSASLYREEDAPNPILQYGRSKLEAERLVLEVERALVTRVCLLYGFSKASQPGFFDRAITAMKQGIPQAFFEDEYRTPLDYGSAVAILTRLAFSTSVGLMHVGGPRRMSRYDLMRRSAEILGIPSELVRSNRRRDVTLREPRPQDVSLDTSRLRSIFPELQGATIENALRT